MRNVQFRLPSVAQKRCVLKLPIIAQKLDWIPRETKITLTFWNTVVSIESRSCVSSLVEKSSNSLASRAYARRNGLQPTTSYFVKRFIFQKTTTITLLYQFYVQPKLYFWHQNMGWGTHVLQIFVWRGLHPLLALPPSSTAYA